MGRSKNDEKYSYLKIDIPNPPLKIEYVIYKTINKGKAETFFPKTSITISNGKEIKHLLSLLLKKDASTYLVCGPCYLILIDDFFSEENTTRYTRFFKMEKKEYNYKIENPKIGLASLFYIQCKQRKFLLDDEKESIETNFNHWINLLNPSINHYVVAPNEGCLCYVQ